MSNIILFPIIASLSDTQTLVLSEERIRAFVEKHARKSPERITALSAKLQLANQNALLLQYLLESIKVETEGSQAAS